MIYTLSVIRKNEITRFNYSNKIEALRIYSLYCGSMQYLRSDIDGVQLWKCIQGLTIDNDRQARIIKQYYK